MHNGWDGKKERKIGRERERGWQKTNGFGYIIVNVVVVFKIIKTIPIILSRNSSNGLRMPIILSSDSVAQI